MKSINCSKPGYTSISYSKIEHIPYNLISATKFNDSSIFIMTISFEFVADIIIPTQVTQV